MNTVSIRNRILILEALERRPDQADGPSGLATDTDLARATVCRHLKVLVARGLVERLGVGTYRLITRLTPPIS